MKAKTSKRKTALPGSASGVRRVGAARTRAARRAAGPGEVETAAVKLKSPARRPAARVKRGAPARPKRKAVSQQQKLTIPPILLEGDSPPAPPVGGPGERYALGPVPPAEHFAGAKTDLPEAYGTRRLFLAARDPHWLYAHWDLTPAQQRFYNARSVDGHLVLRLHVGQVGGEPLAETHVAPLVPAWGAWRHEIPGGVGLLQPEQHLGARVGFRRDPDAGGRAG
jgi:hypothetical protein